MRGASTAGTPRSRGRAMVTANPRGAIHGTIIAAAVIAATAGHEPAAIILAATVATLVIIYLAHVYAEVLAHGLHEADIELKFVSEVMARELALLAAPALSILFLLLAALGLLDEGLAVRLALWSAVAQLFGWGIELGRRSGRSWPRALLVGAINGTFGVVIVVLEALLH